jgi:DNA-binding response OmpR family regulator
MSKIEPGRITRAAIHNEAGEAELRLTAAGNWQLYVRAPREREWRLACSGGFEEGSAIAPQATSPCEPVRLGKLLLDTEARRALVGDAEVRLGAREFELLAALASQPNRVFTKEELLRDVWDFKSLGRTRTVDSHASRLRIKLREAGAGEMVVNCWGVGYRLTDGVELAPASARRAA